MVGLKKASSKSQNLSILLTDIQGYTNTSSQSSREEIMSLLRRHNQLMMPVIEFYNGVIIKSIGDALLCTFQSATDAVVCSIVIQLLLREYNERQQEDFKKMKLRVVINTGDVTLQEKDIFGTAVNVTARMEGLPCFPGGSIGISESTFLLMNRNEIIAEKIGPKQLKGIPDPVTVYKIPLEKQKLTAIPAKLLQLVERVVGGEEKSVKTNINDWTEAVNSFLKEKNLGENITQIKDEITRQLGQKTVLETKKNDEHRDAGTAGRIKSFLVDAVILLVLYLVLNLGFWVIGGFIFGSARIDSDTYYQNSKYTDQSDRWHSEHIGGKSYMVRSRGISEGLIYYNLKYPLLLFWLYFAVLWSRRGASYGQVISHNAVITENGGNLPFALSAKRSAFFLASVLLVGIGCLPLFNQRTFYDNSCGTRVVE
ncbi:MAG: adenylate/guanylate cyclase domain-containing protein [Candidatus Wallbacteria bacterium]|nr:adenylate/guanylate cyclase domain-containing protein [Candidatus Wallbacteria bacterium]